MFMSMEYKKQIKNSVSLPRALTIALGKEIWKKNSAYLLCRGPGASL